MYLMMKGLKSVLISLDCNWSSTMQSTVTPDKVPSPHKFVLKNSAHTVGITATESTGSS